MRLFASREQRELEAVQRRAELAYARAEEAILSSINQEMEEDAAGWKKISDAGGERYDLRPEELKSARAQCLSLWKIDPTAGQIVALLSSGALGRGVPKPRATDKRVQKVIGRVWDDADNQLAMFSSDAQKLTNALLAIEGERFFTLHTSAADSQVKLGSIDAGEISQVLPHPENKRKPVLYERKFRVRTFDFTTGAYSATATEKRWYYVDIAYASYLSETPPEDADQAVLTMLQAAGDSVQQDVCLFHVKTNTVGQRGIPELYRTIDWAKANARSLSNLVTFTKALSMFAWKVKLKTQSTTALHNAAKQFQTPPPGPGAVHVANENRELDPVDVGTGNTSNQQATVRQTMLAAIRSHGFGEHWYGDASTGNLATATAMELPAIWRIEDRQELFTAIFMTVLLFAIERAIERQDFARLPQTVDRYFDLDFPPAQPRTEGAIAQLLGALTTAAGTLLDEKEAAYQGYLALGCNDIDKIMERQFPQGEKLEGEDEETDEPDPAQLDEEPTQEAARPFAARKVVDRFAAALTARVIEPWRKDVTAWLRQQGETPPAQADLTKALRAVKPNAQTIKAVLKEHHLQAANAGGQAAIDKIMQQPRAREAYRAQEAAESFSFNLRDPNLKAELARRGDKVTGDVTATMMQDLRDVLASQFYEEGLGPVAVADSIDSIFPATYANRAKTIARTETLIAQSTVQAATFTRNGVGRKEWVAFLDEKTRDDHAEMNGVTVAMDEPFKLPGGTEIDFPGDPGGDAEQICNCRCDFLPVMDEQPEELWLGG